MREFFAFVVLAGCCAWPDAVRAGVKSDDELIRAVTEVRASFQRGLALCSDNASRVPAAFKPYQSPKIRGGDAPVSVSVDVTGLEALCLTAQGDMGGGHTYWGEPVLTDAAGKTTRLTDLQPQVVVLGWSELRVNKGDGPFYSIGKQRMAFGLFAHVDSYLCYPLDKRYVKFEAKAGISDTGSTDARAVFSVRGGFEAQQVQTIFPNLVSTTSPTALTPDGTLSLNYIDLISPIIAAIQELDKEITVLVSTVASFAERFVSNTLVANDELCVGSTCVTPAQFQAMVAASTEQIQEAQVHSSLDQLYALKHTALSGAASVGISLGLTKNSTTADWIRANSAPNLWPVEGQVTGSFGERIDPFNGEGAFHSGVDISANVGSPVIAPADGAVTFADDRKDYGELRLIALADFAGALHAVVFTRRGANVRIISFRRANRKEVKRYEKEKVQPR